MPAMRMIPYSISHDMRQSLSVIYANAEFLERHDRPASTRADLLLEIQKAVLAMAESIDSLLQLGRNGQNSPLIDESVSTFGGDESTSHAESLGTAQPLPAGMLGTALTQREPVTIAPRTSLYRRIRSFIEEQLADPDLSATMIAQKHRISPRYLHLIFSEQGTTVGTWIRSRRLERSKAELANSRDDRSITEIAMDWGFSDVAHFSRCFSTAYGVSPLRFRMSRRASPG